MYCYNCGKEIDGKAVICVHCGVMVSALQQKPKFYTGGFVLGILSMCLPWYGLILGIIGLPLACISKRKASIIMNSIGIAMWVLIFALFTIIIMYAASGDNFNVNWGFDSV